MGSDYPHAEGLADPVSYIKDLKNFDYPDADCRLVMRDNGIGLSQRRPRDPGAPGGRTGLMAMPAGIGAIDTMIGFASGDMKETYAFITRQTKDRQSKEEFAFPRSTCSSRCPRRTSRPTTLFRTRSTKWTDGASNAAWSASAARTGSGPGRQAIPRSVHSLGGL